MKVTTWNNGNYNKSGAGYGILIPKRERDKYFNRKWDRVKIHIEDTSVEIKLRDTFWTTCNELRSKEIGKYLLKNGLGVWEKWKPHKLTLEVVNNNEFTISLF